MVPRMSSPLPTSVQRRQQTVDRLIWFSLAFLLSQGLRTGVFANRPLHPEEMSLLFQTRNFAEGRVAVPAGELDALLMREPLVVRTRRGWVSPHAPGHSVWMVPGFLLGNAGWMVAISAGLCVVLAYDTGRRLKLPHLLLPALWLLSPFFLFLHGTLMRETTGMLISAALLHRYIVWQQEGRWQTALTCGLLGTALIVTKPWASLWLFAPIAVHVWKGNLPRRPAAAWRGVALLAFGVILGILLTRGYNRNITGDGDVSPFSLLPNAFPIGFGPGLGEVPDHSLIRGIRLMWRYFRLMDRWFLGAPRWSFFVWLGLAAHGWNRQWSGLLLGTVALMFVAHIPVGLSGQSPVGPLFQAEILPHLLLAGALGLSRIWRRGGAHPTRRRLGFLVLLTAAAVSSILFSLERMDRIGEEYAGLWEIERTLDRGSGQKLLLLPERLPFDAPYQELLVFNPLDVSARTLRVIARPEDRPAVAAAFPERTAFLLSGEPGAVLEPWDQPFAGKRRPGSHGHLQPGSGENAGEHRIADEARHHAGFLYFGWYLFLPPGSYEVRFDLRWEQVNPARPLRIELAVNQGERVLAAREISGGLAETSLQVTLDTLTQVEPRVHFGGSGQINLRQISLHRLGPAEFPTSEPER